MYLLALIVGSFWLEEKGTCVDYVEFVGCRWVLMSLARRQKHKSRDIVSHEEVARGESLGKGWVKVCRGR